MKKQGSIQTKLIIIMLLIVAVPLICILAINYKVSIDRAFENIQQVNDVQVEKVRSDAMAVLNQNFSMLDAVANSPLTVDFLKNPTDTQKKSELETYLTSIDEGEGEGSVIVVTGMDGMQLVRSSGECVDVSDRDYFKRASEGGYTCSDIVMSKVDGSRVTVIAIPVFDENGDVIGVLQRNYALSNFHETLADDLAEEGEDILISDSTGSVMAHSGHEIANGEVEDQSANQWYTDSKTMDSGKYVTEYLGTKFIVSWAKDSNTGWIFMVARDYTRNIKVIRAQVLQLVLFGVIFFVIAGVCGFLIARSVAKPLIAISDEANELAEGNFKVNDTVVNQNNELRLLANSFGSMKEKLSGVLKITRKDADEVSEAANQFSNLSEQSTQSLIMIADSTNELADSVNQQKDSVQVAIQNIDEMNQSIQVVVDNSKEIQEASERTTKEAKEGAEVIGKAVSNISTLKNDMDNTQVIMNNLEEQSSKIGQIVDTIMDISSQTNLLALNASIEAARAGEMGKGFAVVATEVGALAQQSQNASDDIKVIVHDIQNSTKEAIRAMSQDTEMIAESVDVVNEAGRAFDLIVEDIEKLSAKINNSVDATRTSIERSENVADVINNMQSLADSILDKTQEISAATEEQTASMEEVAASSRGMSEIADNLKIEVDKFNF